MLPDRTSRFERLNDKLTGEGFTLCDHSKMATFDHHAWTSPCGKFLVTMTETADRWDVAYRIRNAARPVGRDSSTFGPTGASMRVFLDHVASHRISIKKEI